MLVVTKTDDIWEVSTQLIEMLMLVVDVPVVGVTLAEERAGAVWSPAVIVEEFTQGLHEKVSLYLHEKVIFALLVMFPERSSNELFASFLIELLMYHRVWFPPVMYP